MDTKGFLLFVVSLIGKTLIFSLVPFGIAGGISWYLGELNLPFFSMALTYVGGATVFLGSFAVIGGGNFTRPIGPYHPFMVKAPSMVKADQLMRGSFRVGIPIAVAGIMATATSQYLIRFVLDLAE
ncbi:MAG: hypothetical protein GY866_41915 [Proteobacteria bacterium]|nr:hypothetical protein [Pseudomonadota bacterium]